MPTAFYIKQEPNGIDVMQHEINDFPSMRSPNEAIHLGSDENQWGIMLGELCRNYLAENPDEILFAVVEPNGKCSIWTNFVPR